MQKITIAAISGLIALTLASPLGAALHEDCMGVVTTIPAGPETLYIDDRSGGEATFDHWFYQESGRQEGLQTGGTSPDINDPDKSVPFIFLDAPDHQSNRDIFLV